MAEEERLTVVQVLPALESGGVERGTLEVGRFLSQQGHRSIVISAGGRMVRQLESEGSEHVPWDLGRKSLWTLRQVRPLRRFLADQRVDIVHVRSRMPGWVVHLAWKKMAPDARPRLVTTVHGMYSVNRYSAVMTRGETVIAVSDTVRQYILKNYPGVPPSRVVTIPRGVDPAEYPYGYRASEAWREEWSREHPQLSGRRVITLPGRITRLKGHEDFLGLMARLRDMEYPVHGLIVGGAERGKERYLREIERRVRELRLDDAVTFTGHRSDLREILSVSDIALSLSSTPESFGRTVLEALSLGVPAAGYDHGGVGEQLAALFPQGRVPLGDIDALTKTVSAWLLSPPPVPAGHPFTLDSMLGATLEVYQALADRSRESRS